MRANFIDDGTRLWLIDWESAGLCDPYYDLATVAHNNRLTVEQEADLIATYEGRSRPKSLERLARMKVARDFYHVFWYAVQCSSGPVPDRFLAGCRFHAERLASELQSFSEDGLYQPVGEWRQV